MRNRIICLLLSAILTVTPFCTAIAAPVNSVSDNSVVVSENSVEDSDFLESEMTDNSDFEIPETGYVPIGDGFSPAKVNTDADFLDDSVANYGINALGNGVNALGDENSASYATYNKSFIPMFIEDQKSSKMCWALSQETACEISARKAGLIKDTNTGLSAAHLGYFFYNLGDSVSDPGGHTAGEYNRAVGITDWTQAPGNGRLSMWEAVSWIGSVAYDRTDDSEYAFENMYKASNKDTYFSNDTETAYLEDSYHVQNVYMAGLDKAKRIDTKKLIYNLGAVTAGYYASDAYDSFAQGKGDIDDGYPRFGNYYYDGSEAINPNHAITLIGWDDNYSKDNFVLTPSEDGAWLALNSWGATESGLAQNGFFWISYEDAGLLMENVAIAYGLEDASNYDNIYQYDGSCSIGTISAEKFIQFFEINGTEQISAVSVGVQDADTACDISFYKMEGDFENYYDDLSWLNATLNGTPCTMADGEELSAEFLGNTTEAFSYPGYHTVDVRTLGIDAVKRGDVIAVVFDFGKATNVFADSSKTMNNTWKFVTSDDDFKGICESSNSYGPVANKTSLRIKMFTDSFDDLAPVVDFTSTFSTVDLTDRAKKLSAAAYDVMDPNDYSVTFECPSNEYFTLNNETGLITPKKVGGPVTVTAVLHNKNGATVATSTKEISIVSALSYLQIANMEILKIGETKILPVDFAPSTASIEDIKWISSDSTVVSVDNAGKIVGKSYGVAEITCKVGNTVSNKCVVTVDKGYTGVGLDKNSLTLKKGASSILVASIKPSTSADHVEYEWSSSNTNIATVDINGKVIAKDYGKAVITVKIKGNTSYSDTCTVNVVGKLEGVELNKNATAVMKGRTTQLIAQALPEDTTDSVSFTWSSNDTSIATVDSKGLVTGVNFGTATITVRCGTFTDTCRVTVSGQVSAVNISPNKLVMRVGTSKSVKVSLEPEEVADNPVITLTSSNGNVATVAANGTVIAKGEGKCTITAEYNGLKSTCNVIVDSLKAIDGDTSVSSVTVGVGESKGLVPAWNVQDASVVPSVRWKSNNTGIATVDNDGVIKGISKGSTSITLSTADGVFTKTVSVVVNEGGSSTPTEPPTSEPVKLNVSNGTAIKNMIEGQSVQLSVSYSPSNLSDVKITYASSDSDVLSISNSGLVTAKTEGSAIVVVKIASENGTDTKVLPVTVSKQSGGSSSGGTDTPIIPANYTISIYNIDDLEDFEVGDSRGIILIAKDRNGNLIPGVEFSMMADGSYASLEGDNVVVAKKAGTATLYVTAYLGDKELCQKSVYLSIIPSLGTKDNTDGKDDEAGNTDSKPEDNPSAKPSEPSSLPKPVVKPIDDAKDKIDTTVYVSSIKLSGPRKQIAYTGIVPITATITPSNATNKGVTWVCSNTRWATVDQNGLVKAKKAGAGKSVIITCKANDGSGSLASYYVSIPKGVVKKVKIIQPEKRKTLNINKKLQLEPKFTIIGDEKDVIKKLQWTSSNEEWATVDKNGLVKAKSAGEGHTVVITAKVLDGTDTHGTYKIKIVKSVVKKITIKPEKKREVYAGDKIALKANLEWTGRKKDVDMSVVWSSSNEDWATVDKKGVVQTYKAGGDHTVTITATAASGVKDTFKIKILASKVTKVIIEPVKSKTIKVGTKLKLKTSVKTTARKEDANTKLEWTSSNPKIATVDKKGVVRGKKAGKVTITASSTDGSNVKAKVRIKVIKK